MENRKIEKIRLSNRCSWMPAMPDCTYKYFDKSFDPSPSVRRKICKNLPTGNCSPARSKILKALISNKSERTTQDSNKLKKKKKSTHPVETNVSRNSYQEIPSPRPAFTGATCLAALKNAIFRTTCEYIPEIQERNAYRRDTIRLSLLRFARIPHQTKAGEVS